MRQRNRRSERRGLSLIEVLLVSSILAVLIGMSLIGVQAVRSAARTTQSSNNLAQLARASEEFAGDHDGRLPPLSGTLFRGSKLEAYGSYFLAVLPYVEQGNAFAEYQASMGPEPPPIEGNVTILASLRVSSGFHFRVLESPNDPSITPKQTGLSSYAVNAWAVNNDEVRLATTFVDGRSNTLLFGEHYALDCQKRLFSWSSTAPGVANPQSLDFRIAAFAYSPSNDVTPVRTGELTTASRSGVTFQTLPRIDDCDPSLPQGLQSGGMLVAVADGSVRLVSRSISETVFWSAVTPSGGEARGEWR